MFLGNDFIVSAQGDRRAIATDPRVVVIYDSDSYGEHPITRGLPGRYTFFPFTQSLEKAYAGKVGVEATWILRSSLYSWAEKDPATVVSGEPKFEEDIDQAGPVVFGVALEVDRQAHF